METADHQQVLASAGTSSSTMHLVEQPETSYHTDVEAIPGQLNCGGLFTGATVSASPTTHEAASYKEVVNGLNCLWTDKMKEIEHLTEDHWKSQDFPLARIKKIMRMDEDVKMISTEVPVMFSKVLEIFITELTMRSWLHTEESKRRTVQRSDIAMAITKNDMFDFLIDIVPRDEIQLKTKAQKDGGESLQLLPPDMLHDYIQQVIAQTFATMEAAEGKEGGESSAASANTLQVQQLQLIQQLAQLQQAQQEQQQQQQEEQVVEVVNPRHYDTSGVDIQVLQSSATSSANQPLDSTTVGGALDKIAKGGSDSGVGMRQDMNYGQQALHHVNPQGFQQLQQQHQQQSTIFPNDQHPHITTVVIPQPLSPAQPPSGAAMVLDPAGFPLHQTHDMTSRDNMTSPEEGHLREQLESLATEQFISRRVPVASATGLQGDDRAVVMEGVGSDEIPAEDGMNFQSIREGESIVRSISPVRGLSTGVFPADKTY